MKFGVKKANLATLTCLLVYSAAAGLSVFYVVLKDQKGS